MSTTVAPANAVSAQTLETVIGSGDLSKLSPLQRVEYYGEVCRTVGLNPLTRPFRFMQFQGQTVLYATRDCADQLRSLRKIDLTLTEKRMEGELFMVTARAKTPDGRHDEDVGAIMLGKLQGDARANAIMKCITKAKRRVTLSVCGLGLLDETEVETLPHVQTFDATAEPTHDRQSQVYQREDHPALSRREQVNRDTPMLDPATRKQTTAEWLDDYERDLGAAQTTEEVDAVLGRKDVQAMAGWLKNGVLDRFNTSAARAHKRVATQHEAADDGSGWPGPSPEQVRSEREAADATA
jgi:hypothetical protein